MRPTRKSIMPGFGGASAGFGAFPPPPSFLSAAFLAAFSAFLSFLAVVGSGVAAGGCCSARDVAARDLVTVLTALPNRATTGRQLVGRKSLSTLYS